MQKQSVSLRKKILKIEIQKYKINNKKKTNFYYKNESKNAFSFVTGP